MEALICMNNLEGDALSSTEISAIVRCAPGSKLAQEGVHISPERKKLIEETHVHHCQNHGLSQVQD